MTVPLMKQIVAAGTGVTSHVTLYGLGEDGVVYRYVERGEDSYWKPLLSPVRNG